MAGRELPRAEGVAGGELAVRAAAQRPKPPLIKQAPLKSASFLLELRKTQIISMHYQIEKRPSVEPSDHLDCKKKNLLKL